MLTARPAPPQAQLLDSLFGTERGLAATSEVRAEINELITQLEGRNPNPSLDQAAALLDGRWKLVYASNSGVLALLGMGRLPGVTVGDITQTVESANLTVENQARHLLGTRVCGSASLHTPAHLGVGSPILHSQACLQLRQQRVLRCFTLQVAVQQGSSNRNACGDTLCLQEQRSRAIQTEPPTVVPWVCRSRAPASCRTRDLCSTVCQPFRAMRWWCAGICAQCPATSPAAGLFQLLQYLHPGAEAFIERLRARRCSNIN